MRFSLNVQAEGNWGQSPTSTRGQTEWAGVSEGCCCPGKWGSGSSRRGVLGLLGKVGPPGLRGTPGYPLVDRDHPWNITSPALLGMAALPTKVVQDWGSSPSFPFSSSSSWSHCQPLSLAVSLQAWLTEIHEYAQQDVVLMLLGNKVSLPPGLCQSLLFLPRWSHRQESLTGHNGTGDTCW